jgi:uncharacterized protein YgiB involved in biofilm formation
MKRSRSLRLILMGSAALALSACDDKKDAQVFETVGQCMDLGHTQQECDDAISQARQHRLETAPRYASKADCEAEFGKCEEGSKTADAPKDPNAPAQSYAHSESGGFFMPLITGYMIGRMLGGGTYGFAPMPLYTPMGGGGFYTGGGTRVATGPGATTVAQSALNEARTTSTLSRGGFGARARAMSVSS